jgi:flagellar motor switch protein FliG
MQFLIDVLPQTLCVLLACFLSLILLRTRRVNAQILAALADREIEIGEIQEGLAKLKRKRLKNKGRKIPRIDDAGLLAPWKNIPACADAPLARFITGLFPEDGAIALALCDPDLAAAALTRLDDAVVARLIAEIGRLDEVAKERIERIGTVIRTELLADVARKAKINGARELSVTLLWSLPAERGEKILNAIGSADPGAAAELSEARVTFDDVIRVRAPGLQILLANIPKDDVVLALKGASDDAKESLFANLSEMARTMLLEDMLATGPVPLPIVDAAQARIVSVLRTLRDESRISLRGRDDGPELYY